ncbi:MAG TPA: hypothetical protein VLS89_10280, partial [Candidatus Nanopelagicales bacterium]|nr:hypothetical protein [Candidatus Nanopelagicales bacterium]
MLLPRFVIQPSIQTLPEGPERLDEVKEASLLTIARSIPPDQRSPAPSQLQNRLQEAERVLYTARRDATTLLIPPADEEARPLTPADLRTLAQTIALVRRAQHRLEEAERPRRLLGGEENPAAEMVRQHREDLLGWLGSRLAGD